MKKIPTPIGELLVVNFENTRPGTRNPTPQKLPENLQKEMNRCASLFSAALLLAAAAILSSSSYSVSATVLEWRSCTDTIFCQEQTCSAPSSAVTNVCRPPGNSTQPSSAQICNPELVPLAIVFSYSDSFCTVPLSSQALVCDTCNSKNEVGACVKVGNAESIEILACNSTKIGECSSCTPVLTIPAGDCERAVDKRTGLVSYFKYSGATLGTLVESLEWAPPNQQCTGTPTKYQIFPTDHCIVGSLLSCTYSNTSVTSRAAAWGGANACPRTRDTVKPLVCGESIAHCARTACSPNAENANVGECLACIKLHTRGVDAKTCCKTLSYYSKFDCAMCNAL